MSYFTEILIFNLSAKNTVVSIPVVHALWAFSEWVTPFVRYYNCRVSQDFLLDDNHLIGLWGDDVPSVWHNLVVQTLGSARYRGDGACARAWFSSSHLVQYESNKKVCTGELHSGAECYWFRPKQYSEHAQKEAQTKKTQCTKWARFQVITKSVIVSNTQINYSNVGYICKYQQVAIFLHVLKLKFAYMYFL